MSVSSAFSNKVYPVIISPTSEVKAPWVFTALIPALTLSSVPLPPLTPSTPPYKAPPVKAYPTLPAPAKLIPWAGWFQPVSESASKTDAPLPLKEIVVPLGPWPP